MMSGITYGLANMTTWLSTYLLDIVALLELALSNLFILDRCSRHTQLVAEAHSSMLLLPLAQEKVN